MGVCPAGGDRQRGHWQRGHWQRRQPDPQSRPLLPRSLCPCAGMLRFEPAKRTSVTDALGHSFFDGMAMQAPQLVASKPVDAATIDFEHSEIKLPQV